MIQVDDKALFSRASADNSGSFDYPEIDTNGNLGSTSTKITDVTCRITLSYLALGPTFENTTLSVSSDIEMSFSREKIQNSAASSPSSLALNDLLAALCTKNIHYKTRMNRD